MRRCRVAMSHCSDVTILIRLQRSMIRLQCPMSGLQRSKTRLQWAITRLQRSISDLWRSNNLLQRSVAARNRVIVSLQRRKHSQTRSVAAKQRGRGVLQHYGVGKLCIGAAWRWAIVMMRLCIAFLQLGSGYMP